MVEINWKQCFVAAVVFAIIALVVHSIGAMLTLNYYANPAYFSLWSSLMMPGESAPGIEFFAVSILFNFVTGLIFAVAYSLLRNSVPGTGLMKGLNYGGLLFLLSSIPASLSTYLILAVPSFLVVTWAIESLLILLLTGVVFASVIKK